MPFKYLLIATFGALLFINYIGTAATAAADLSQKKAEFLPLASFLYANRDPMRVGWYNTSSMPSGKDFKTCLLYTSPSPRDKRQSRMPSSA